MSALLNALSAAPAGTLAGVLSVSLLLLAIVAVSLWASAGQARAHDREFER